MPEFTKILIWDLSWLEGEMCIALHVCVLMVKEAYIPDQRQGKGSVFTGKSLVLDRLIKDGK